MNRRDAPARAARLDTIIEFGVKEIQKHSVFIMEERSLREAEWCENEGKGKGSLLVCETI